MPKTVAQADDTTIRKVRWAATAAAIAAPISYPVAAWITGHVDLPPILNVEHFRQSIETALSVAITGGVTWATGYHVSADAEELEQ